MITPAHPASAADLARVKPLYPRLTACFVRAVGKERLSGLVAVTLTVAADGKVVSSTATQSARLPAAVAPCMQKVLEGTRFTAPSPTPTPQSPALVDVAFRCTAAWSTEPAMVVDGTRPWDPGY